MDRSFSNTFKSDDSSFVKKKRERGRIT